ncbi:MAG: Rrf2 family transcriptional regulator [Bacteroidales bacterium]|jgi:Rrf2 family iron-sulfur cluster assembly transcriptional regulator|nr:Rrf2 family transcriptional regulator [Bacteroidales bacterium]
MNLSNTSQYAIRILGLMAMTGNDTITATFLVSKLKISDKYARSLMTKLTKAGLIRAVQGRNGGYRFNMPPDAISLKKVISAVENPDKYYSCLIGFSLCRNEKPCALHNKWIEVKDRINRFLETTYVSDINGLVSDDLVETLL